MALVGFGSVLIVAAALHGCRSADPARVPEVYRANVVTSKGTFVIEVRREWAPLAAGRFHELASSGFFREARFYRVIPRFVAQFGMAADPASNEAWRERGFTREPLVRPNNRGTICFTGSALPNSMTTNLFINLADNQFLDSSSTPFGIVVEGMEVVDSLYAGYGENAPVGTGPDQTRLVREGNRYLNVEFPKLDYIIDVSVD